MTHNVCVCAVGGELNSELAHWLLDAPIVHSPARAIIVP